MKNRDAESTEESIIASLFVGVLSIPQVTEIDALLVPQGEDELWRVKAAVDDWEEKKTSARHLLIGGDNWKIGGKNRHREGKLSPDISIDSIQKPPFNLKRLDGVIIDDYSESSLSQTIWAAKKMQELGLESCRLYVSSYHVVRWYLTFIKSASKLGYRFAVIPIPTPLSMDIKSPLTGLNMWEFMPSEVERIKKYQEKGDVTTLPELKEYLSWLWQEHLLARQSKRVVI